MQKSSFRDLPSELEGIAPPPDTLRQVWSRAEAVRKQIADLAGLYDRMDAAYRKIAGLLGFNCHNCNDNCCRQTFYHFTWAEYLYLLQGLFELPAAKRSEILAGCRRNLKTAPGMKSFCGANFKERCRIYAHRPMICRLHGITYHLVHPDGRKITGRGCFRFEARNRNKPAQKLDRTPFYTEMARLEQRIRQRLAISTGLKMTVSQMLLSGECLQ